MKTSAGILLYRWRGDPAGPGSSGAPPHLEVLLVHPGGPLWARRDSGAWSIPKGEVEPGEEPADVARREFQEETGQELAPGVELLDLGAARLPSGKAVRAWAGKGDLDPATSVSNTFSMEWPPRSGRTQVFPEVDRVAWFEPSEARLRLNPGQVPLLERLLESLECRSSPPAASEDRAARSGNRPAPDAH